MKIVKSIKFLFLLSTLLYAFCEQIKKETEKTPIYETPYIRKAESPLKNNYNPRIENINLSSADKNRRIIEQQAKDTHRANLIRDFTVPNLQKWVDHLQKENINSMEEHDVLDNISSIKVYSKSLQSKIIELGNKLKTQVGLFDLLIKEKKVMQEKVREIKSEKTGSPQICKRLDELSGSTETARTAVKQQVKDVLNEIKKVNYSVKKLEQDEKQQKHIIQKKGSLNKLHLQGQYVEENKKREINSEKEKDNQIKQAAARIRKEIENKKQTINEIRKEKQNIAKSNNVKTVAKKIQLITNIIDKNLNKIVNKVKNEKSIVNQNKELKKVNKQIQTIYANIEKVAPSKKPSLIKKVSEISKKAQAIKTFIADKAVDKLEELKNQVKHDIKKLKHLKTKFSYARTSETKNDFKAKIHDTQKTITKAVKEIQNINKIKVINDAPKQIIAERVPHPIKTPIVVKMKLNNLKNKLTKNVEQIIKLQNKVNNVRDGMKPIIKKKIENLKKEVKQEIKQIKKINSSIINKANTAVDTKIPNITKKVEKINNENKKPVLTTKSEQKLEAKVNSSVKSLQQKKRKIKSLIKKIVEKAEITPNKTSIRKKIVVLKEKVKEIAKKIQTLKSKIPEASPKANSHLNKVNRSNPPSSDASENFDLLKEIRTTFLSRLADITAKNKLDKHRFKKIYKHFMDDNNINMLIKLKQIRRNTKIDEFIRSFLARILN